MHSRMREGVKIYNKFEDRSIAMYVATDIVDKERHANSARLQRRPRSIVCWYLEGTKA